MNAPAPDRDPLGGYLYAEKPPRLARQAAGAVFLAVLVLAALSALRDWGDGRIAVPPAQRTFERFADGGTAQYLAGQLARGAFPTALADAERGAGWLLTGSLGPRVRQGCPGWLFLVDELAVHPHARADAAARLDAVARVRDRLSRQGIGLLVAVVPDKSRVERAQLCGLYRPASSAGRLDDWMAGLRQRQVPLVDLFPVLDQAARAGQPPFLRTDTHWSEHGARLAAEAVAQAVRRTGVAAAPPRHFTLSAGPEHEREGDLVRLAGIDWLPARWKPAPDRVRTTTLTAAAEPSASADSADDLFGDAGNPTLALLGTSFSRTSNFTPFLENGLQAVVPSFARDGGDFWGSAQQYFASPSFRQTPPELVIWEIPERVLQMPVAPAERAWMEDPVPRGPGG
jgi:alginate O-acetyltransferase complex protein AlgJ